MSEIRLGKIEYAEFGFGGYQDAMLGLSLVFKGQGWGVTEFLSGGWYEVLKADSPNCNWEEKDRADLRNALCKEIDNILRSAKVKSVSKLIGKPVEVEFVGGKLENWRILEEVL